MATDLELYSSLAQFSSDLYGQVVTDQSNVMHSVLLSPLSIYVALLMTLVGAGGQTRAEMRNTLHIPTHLEGHELHRSFGSTLMKQIVGSQYVNVSLANRLFVLCNVKILQNFKSTLEESYSADVGYLSQCADPEKKRRKVNQWVSEKTNSKIAELFPENVITQHTVMTIVNAVYLKGVWKFPFRKSLTELAPFYSLYGASMDVPMMFMEEQLPYQDLFELNSQAVKLPFQNSLWELLLVLPDQHDGLPELLTHFRNGDTMASILAKPFHQRGVFLDLPQIKLAKLPSLNLKQMLQNNGMISLFEKSADLSKMSSKKNLYVAEFMHKLVIEIDEKRVEAAATLGLKFASLTQIASINFLVDHPFFMALIYNSTVPVFMGHVTKPEV